MIHPTRAAPIHGVPIPRAAIHGRTSNGTQSAERTPQTISQTTSQSVRRRRVSFSRSDAAQEEMNAAAHKTEAEVGSTMVLC